MLFESGVKDWQKEEEKRKRNVCTSRMGFDVEGEGIFIRVFFLL